MTAATALDGDEWLGEDDEVSKACRRKITSATSLTLFFKRKLGDRVLEVEELLD